MNKTELVAKIAEVAGLSKADAKKALDATVEAVKEALVAGENVQLVGFGTYSVTERPAREGVNPRTGEKLATLGKRHTNQATLSELRLAVGVNSFVEVYTTYNCPCAAV